MNSRPGFRTQQRLYIVTVRSEVHRNRPLPDRIELTFAATQPGSPNKVWRASHYLVDDLFVPVTTTEESSEIVARLREGQIVTLPDRYTSFQLVQLGFRVFYRKRVSKPDERKHWEPKDYIAFK